jgi:hypothetical protein
MRISIAVARCAGALLTVALTVTGCGATEIGGTATPPRNSATARASGGAAAATSQLRLYLRSIASDNGTVACRLLAPQLGQQIGDQYGDGSCRAGIHAAHQELGAETSRQLAGARFDLSKVIASGSEVTVPAEAITLPNGNHGAAGSSYHLVKLAGQWRLDRLR